MILDTQEIKLIN